MRICRGDEKEIKAAVRKQRRCAQPKSANHGQAEKAGVCLSKPCDMNFSTWALNPLLQGLDQSTAWYNRIGTRSVKTVLALISPVMRNALMQGQVINPPGFWEPSSLMHAADSLQQEKDG